jgi:hypothetical protein
MDWNDHHVTIFANNSLSHFPSNTSSDFINHLSRPLDTPTSLYEVGLVGVSMRNEASVVVDSTADTSNPNSNNQPTPQDKFFETEFETVTVLKYETVQLTIPKDSTVKLHIATSLMNNIFREKRLQLEIQEIFITESDIKTRIIWSDPIKQKTLHLPTELAAILGFDRDDFAPGTYISQYYRSEYNYNKLPDKHNFEFEFVNWQKYAVRFPEPPSFTIDSFCHTLANSFSEKGFKIGVIQSKIISYITIKIFDFELRLSFSPFVNKLLGIGEGYVFHRLSNTIYLPNELIQRLTKKPDPPPPVPIEWKSLDVVYIQSDVVEPQLCGSKSLPILRILPKSQTSNWDIQTFEPVYYLPLSREHIKSIRVWLTDENLVPIQTSQYPTTVHLHFRRKQL